MNIKPTVHQVSPATFNAVNHATDDVTMGGLLSKPNISASEVKDIEKAMAQDGTIDQGEEQLLTALRTGSQVTISSGGQTTTLNPSEINFPTPASVPNRRAGERVAVYDNGTYRSAQVMRVPNAVPAQTTGRQTDIANSNSSGDFATARTRMLDVNNWGESTVRGANFSLMGADGKPKTGTPAVGDYVRINLPMIGHADDDWVQIQSITDNPNEVSITVRPSKDPTSTSNATDHFFTDAATNTFTIAPAEGGGVVAKVNGRNEVNAGYGVVAGNGQLFDAVPGMGGQKDQWHHWTNYIVQND